MSYELPAPVSATGTWCECGEYRIEGAWKLCPICLDDANRAAAELDGAA